MARALVSLVLWLLVAAGVLGTAFFTAMLLTPGYGDAVIAAAAVLCALVALGAGAALRRRGRGRRAREEERAADVLRGDVLEQVPPSRRRWRTVAVAAGVLLALSLVPVAAGTAAGLVLAVPWTLALAAALWLLAPGRNGLRVTTRGLVVSHLGRTRAHRWPDVDDFRVYEVRTRWTTQRLVGWRAAEHVRRRWARWLRWPSGVDDGLPTEYEADPDELAARLQRWRDAHAGP